MFRVILAILFLGFVWEPVAEAAETTRACVTPFGVLRIPRADHSCRRLETEITIVNQVPAGGETDTEVLQRISALETQVATLQDELAALQTEFTPPSVSIDDVVITEPDCLRYDTRDPDRCVQQDSVLGTFTIVLSKPSPDFIFMDAEFGGVTADSSDVGFSSFFDVQPVTFAPGETSKVFTFSVRGDDDPENDEFALFTLSNFINVTAEADILDATLTIVNNDFGNVFVQNAGLDEGDAAPAEVQVSVCKDARNIDVTVDYETSDDTATAGEDYVAVSGQLAIPAGASCGVISVPLLPDTVVEGEEAFGLTISNAVNAEISTASGQVTIFDDDAVLRVSPGQVVEGNTGDEPYTVMAFLVTLDQEVPTDVELNTRTLQLADDLAERFGPDQDFRSAFQFVRFEPGETSKTVEVLIVGDLLQEPDETFTFEIYGARGARIDGGTVKGTILNDD